MTKTLEELKAEVARLEKEAKEAKEEAKRKAAQEKRAKELREAQDFKFGHAEKIVAELRGLGYNNAACKKGNGSTVEISIDGTFGYESCGINFDWNYTSTGWSARKSKLVVEVGHYSNKSRYPLKKDGTFSYTKLAEKFDEIYKARQAKIARDVEKRNNYEQSKEIKERLCKKFGLSEFTSKIQPNNYDGTKVGVKLVFSLTEDKVEELFNAIEKLGYKIKD